MTGKDFKVGQRLLIKGHDLFECMVVEKSKKAVNVRYKIGVESWVTTEDYGDTWNWQLVEVLPPLSEQKEGEEK